MSEAMIKVAVIGDSISAGNPGWDPNPALREREGDNPQSQYEYWAALKDPRLDFDNRGVGGETVAQIASRLEEGVAGADVLIVQGGINDIVQGLPIEGAADGLRAMVARGQELGLGVVIADVLPWNKGWPDAEPKIRRLNELIAEIAADAQIDVLRVPRHARGSRPPGSDEAGMDGRRQPPVRRGPSPARRARIPPSPRLGEDRMSTDTVLMYSDTVRSPDLRYVIPHSVADPFLYVEHDGHQACCGQITRGRADDRGGRRRAAPGRGVWA